MLDWRSSKAQSREQTRKQKAMLLWSALLWEAGGAILFSCICAFLLHIFCGIPEWHVTGLAARPRLTSSPQGSYGKCRTCTHVFAVLWALLLCRCSFDYHWSFLKKPKFNMKVDDFEGRQLTEVGLLLFLLRRINNFQKFWSTLFKEVALDSRQLHHEK